MVYSALISNLAIAVPSGPKKVDQGIEGTVTANTTPWIFSPTQPFSSTPQPFHPLHIMPLAYFPTLEGIEETLIVYYHHLLCGATE